MVVGFDHVGESGPESLVVGTDQGVMPQEVDVVLDHHHVPLAKQGVQPPARVRDEQVAAAQLLHHPDREGHLRGGVALVQVEPALHRHDRMTGQGPADELTLVTLDR